MAGLKISTASHMFNLQGFYQGKFNYGFSSMFHPIFNIKVFGKSSDSRALPVKRRNGIYFTNKSDDLVRYFYLIFT